MNVARKTRAMVFEGPGQPLQLREFHRPTLGAGELLVKVECSTLCGSDLHTYLGRRTADCPTILGHEIVGRIDELRPVIRRSIWPAGPWPSAIALRGPWRRAVERVFTASWACRKSANTCSNTVTSAPIRAIRSAVGCPNIATWLQAPPC